MTLQEANAWREVVEAAEHHNDGTPIGLMRHTLAIQAGLAETHTNDEWVYSCPSRLILEEGHEGTPGAVITYGEPKSCFGSALNYAREYALHYVEGYAIPSGMGNMGLALPHAWCEDDDALVHEVTWDVLGEAYLGVVMDIRAVFQVVVQQGCYGVLQNDWLNKHVLMRHGIEELRA